MNTLLAWVVEGTAVAVIAGLGLQLMPRVSASARHLFCWLALLIVVAWPLGAVVSWPAGAERTDMHLSVSESNAGEARAGGREVATVAGTPSDSALMLPPLPEPMLRTMTIVWLSLVSVALLRLLLALHRLRVLTRDARPFPPALVRAMAHWQRTRRRPARLLLSDRLDGACAVGFWRPSILVSSRLAATLDLTALESLVLHEQAHLRRGDDWLGLLQQIVLALTGVHPAVWWISRQIDHEREAACDRDVVWRTGAPLPYAKALAQVAAAVQRPSWHGTLAPAALLDRAGLARRVERLLEPTPASRLRLSAGAAAAAIALVAAVVSLSYLPPFVLFAAPQTALGAVVGPPVPFVPTHPTPPVELTVPPSAPRRQAAVVAMLQPAPVAVTMPQGPVATTGVSGPIGEHVDAGVSPIRDTDAGSVHADRVTDRIAQTPQDVAMAAAPAGDAAVLHATPIPFATPAAVASDAQDSDWIAQPFIGTGKGVARASVAASDAVSRAGQSIGRFFKGQSLTVARQF